MSNVVPLHEKGKKNTSILGVLTIKHTALFLFPLLRVFFLTHSKHKEYLGEAAR